MPTFWLGGLMLLYFGVQLNWFPVSGVTSPWIEHPDIFSYIADVAHHLFLPMMCLGLGTFGGIFLIMRNTLLDVFSQDYILTARAAGLSNRTILFKNALNNAMLPMITIIAIRFGFMVGGAILTETIFSWPGIGLRIYEAVLQHDYPVLQGAFLIITIFVVLANLIADITYQYMDPRVRY
jgi:peptide/nickel transport system permease protein